MKIVWLSDFDPVGSGYQNLSTTICTGLVEKGHEIKAVGLHYNMQEHDFPFSIIPAMDLREAFVATYNLRRLWNFDLLIVAMDIHIQNVILKNIQQFRDFKYIGIMPIEADPLSMSWAMVLLQMDLPLIISEFGTEEAHKANVTFAKHIPLGVSNIWKPSTHEERDTYRKGLLGVTDPDTFVVLTVADNQERKNLWAGIDIFKKFSDEYPNSRYVIVTRSNSAVGWNLYDLATEYGINDRLIIMERGMPVEDLVHVYNAADAFLLPSKAEGLGLPLMEAMKVGLPCIATDCTGMRELLQDNRGYLIPTEYIHRDPFGNGRRYWIDRQSAYNALIQIAEGQGLKIDAAFAKEWIDEHTWDKTVDFLDNEIKGLMKNG